MVFHRFNDDFLKKKQTDCLEKLKNVEFVQFAGFVVRQRTFERRFREHQFTRGSSLELRRYGLLQKVERGIVIAGAKLQIQNITSHFCDVLFLF